VRNLGQLLLPGCHGVDLYPQQLQSQIDALNEQGETFWCPRGGGC
jgi:hypothetical protein